MPRLGPPSCDLPRFHGISGPVAAGIWDILHKVPNGYRPSHWQRRCRRERFALAQLHSSLPAPFNAPVLISRSTNRPTSTRYPPTTWRFDKSGYVTASTVG